MSMWPMPAIEASASGGEAKVRNEPKAPGMMRVTAPSGPMAQKMRSRFGRVDAMRRKSAMSPSDCGMKASFGISSDERQMESMDAASDL